jgi:large subunit ribosomal protein L23
MRTPFEILTKPVITERSTVGQTLECPQYTFKVSIDANKHEIRTAVESAFNVKVRSVNTIRVMGKIKRVRARAGKRSDWKKAIVTLEKGNSIALY